MRRWAGVLAAQIFVCFALAAQDQPKGRLLSQGEYSIIFKNPGEAEKTVKLDHWRMYAMANGSISVDTGPAISGGAKVEEHLTFARGMKPRGLVLTFSSPANQPQVLRCDYKPSEVSCTLVSETPASAKIMQKMPYAFMGLAWDLILDPLWLHQSLAFGVKRKTGSTTFIPVISIDDGEHEDSIILKVEEVQQVQYLGRDKLTVVSQDVLAHKYRLLDKGAPEVDFWMSDSGLILREFHYDGNSSWVLTSYQGPSIH